MRKIIALIVCILLIAGMVVPAFAVTPQLEIPDIPVVPEIKVDLDTVVDSIANALTAEHTIEYDFNGGFTFAFTNRRITMDYCSKVKETGVHTICNIVPIKPFYKFCGWEAPDGTVFKAGDIYYGLRDTRFTAIWERYR